MFPLSSRRRRGGAGLTLLEFLFAVSIITFALLGVAGMFPSALRSVVGGGQMTKATVLAEAMIDMMRNDPFDILVSRYDRFDSRDLAATCPVVPSGEAAASTKQKWTCDILATGAQDSGRGLPDGYGTVGVICANADGTIGSCSSTALRRLTVTVTWGRGGSFSSSLVTYVARGE